MSGKMMGMVGPMGRVNPRLAKGLLLLVGAAYLVAQLLLFSPDRAPSWDEAIYLSQVTPGVQPIAFAPSRARGITLLVAPVALAGGSVASVRLFLAVASSVALVASFLPWVALVGLGAPVAASLLGFTWLGLFYGSEVMPNLWAALLAVAATGALVRRVDGTARWGSVVASASLGLMALVRPADALVLGGALAAYVIVVRRSSIRVLAPLGAGLVLGWAPWLVEMSVRFGGPVRALREAGSLGHLTAAGIGDRLLQNLALTDGPTIGPEAHPHVPLAGALWWGATVALAVVAVVRKRCTPAFGPVRYATLAGSALAGEYLLLVSGLAPRFLLPAYALLSLPAAVGLVSLWAGAVASRVAGAAAVAVLAALTVWQLGMARSIGTNATVARRSVSDAGLQVRRLAAGSPCVVASSVGFPQVAFSSGCEGRGLRGTDTESLAALQASAPRGDRVFVVLQTIAPQGSPLEHLVATTIPAAGGGRWSIYEVTAAVP